MKKLIFALLTSLIISHTSYASPTEKYLPQLTKDCGNYIQTMEKLLKLYRYNDEEIALLLEYKFDKELKEYTPSYKSKYGSNYCQNNNQNLTEFINAFDQFPASCKTVIYSYKTQNLKLEGNHEEKKEKLARSFLTVDVDSRLHIQRALKEHPSEATQACEILANKGTEFKFGYELSKFAFLYINALEEESRLYPFSNEEIDNMMVDKIINGDGIHVSVYEEFETVFATLKWATETYNNITRYKALPQSCKDLIVQYKKLQDEQLSELPEDELIYVDLSKYNNEIRSEIRNFVSRTKKKDKIDELAQSCESLSPDKLPNAFQYY